jgi:hypothetical protein
MSDAPNRGGRPPIDPSRIAFSLTTKLPRAAFDRLKAEAARERVTVSAYLRRLVMTHLTPRR